MTDQDPTRIFEQVRPNLLGLGYRILGSRADAEDAVQDTFVKWTRAEKAAIEEPAAWLTTTCTRRCLDLLRAAHRARVDYVGTWLPEPIQTPVAAEAERGLELASSLTTAFLLLLERLTPKERAAYLLHEISSFPTPTSPRPWKYGKAPAASWYRGRKPMLDRPRSGMRRPSTGRTGFWSPFASLSRKGRRRN